MNAPSAPLLLDVRELRLDDARALLEHDRPGSATEPAAQTQPRDYLQGIIDRLCDLSLRDPLTGLANRRHFNNLLRSEIDSVARTGESALLLMLDIDHFKAVNDTYGHQAGDLVLQGVGRCLAGCVRPMDTVARYGGEEFAAILPNCPPSFGLVVAERIRTAVEALRITVAPLVDLHITISVGGAFAPEWVRSTPALWTERADAQLYRAKHSGRNRVVIDAQPEVAVSAEEKSLLFGMLSAADDADWSATPQDNDRGDAQPLN